MGTLQERQWKIVEEEYKRDKERQGLLVQLQGLVDTGVSKPLQIPTVDTLGIKEDGVRQTASDCLMALRYVSVASRDPDGGQNVTPEEAKAALAALGKGIKEASRMLREGQVGNEYMKQLARLRDPEDLDAGGESDGELSTVSSK